MARLRLTRAILDAVASRVHVRQWRAVRIHRVAPPPFASLSAPEQQAWREGARTYLEEAVKAGWRPPVATTR